MSKKGKKKPIDTSKVSGGGNKTQNNNNSNTDPYHTILIPL